MKPVLPLAVAAVVLLGCAEDAVEAPVESRTLPQMLALGANQYLIDKYEQAGRETESVLFMLESVGRDGAGAHADAARELIARGFALDERTAAASRNWRVERRPM